jgi:hypothetical protein
MFRHRRFGDREPNCNGGFRDVVGWQYLIGQLWWFRRRHYLEQFGRWQHVERRISPSLQFW